MKVRESQIPEENGKPKRFTAKSSENITEENSNPLKEDENNDEDNQYFRMALSLDEAGIVISLMNIFSIDKIFKTKQSQVSEDVFVQYGIVFNKDMQPSMRFPRTNIELWYDKEEVRNQRYDKIVAILEKSGFKIIHV